MFTEGKDPIEVLKGLDLEYDEVRKYHGEYLSLKDMTDFLNFYKENNRFLPFLLRVIERMNRFELSENDVDTFIHYLNQFENINNIKIQLRQEVNCLELRKKGLEEEFPNGKSLGLTNIVSMIVNIPFIK